MQALAGISFVGLIAVSLVVGVRMLRLARATRGLAERSLGLSLLLVMGIGYPGMIVLEADLGLSLDATRALTLLLNGAMDAGFLMLFVFTAHVFRPGAAWTRWVVGAAATLFVAHVVLVADKLYSTNDLATVRPELNVIGMLALGTAAIAYAWSGAEAFAHWGRLRRRLRLGLVDPVLCDRMWLWAMMSTASVVGALANLAYLVLGIDVLVTPSAMLVTSLTGLGQGLFLWLTFLPPAAYVRFVKARAGA